MTNNSQFSIIHLGIKLRKEVILIHKYIGTYRVFQAIDLKTGKPSDNDDDVFLKGKYKTEVYRYDNKNLALYFVAKQTLNNILPQLKELKVKLTLLVDGDYETVCLFAEKDIHKIHSILKFQIKGKNIPPNSIKTARRLK